ncbi:Uncharacterized protein FKW44_017781, partial [Caligus rogercresseyi]
KHKEDDINHVTVKLPPFTSLRPTSYFTRIETQFEIARISNERTKFNYLLSSIPEVTLYKIPDYIISKCQSSPEPYTELKGRLLRMCVGSKQQLTTDLVGLINNKDNLSVSEMEAKAWDCLDAITKDGTDLKETLTKHMVLNCLPSHSRQHLTQGFEEVPYEQFIKFAKTEEKLA